MVKTRMDMSIDLEVAEWARSRKFNVSASVNEYLRCVMESKEYGSNLQVLKEELRQIEPKHIDLTVKLQKLRNAIHIAEENIGQQNLERLKKEQEYSEKMSHCGNCGRALKDDPGMKYLLCLDCLNDIPKDKWSKFLKEEVQNEYGD